MKYLIVCSAGGLMYRHAWLFVAIVFFFPIIADPAIADNRVALVIGNGAYAHARHLPNPSHDADDVAAALKRTGFQPLSGSTSIRPECRTPPSGSHAPRVPPMSQCSTIAAMRFSSPVSTI